MPPLAFSSAPPPLLPRLRWDECPSRCGHQHPRGTASWVIEHPSPSAGRGQAVTSLEAHPLPFWTFEITYCCYFFSLLT